MTCERERERARESYLFIIIHYHWLIITSKGVVLLITVEFSHHSLLSGMFLSAAVWVYYEIFSISHVKVTCHSLDTDISHES